MRASSHLGLVAMCLTWISVIRGFAQAPDPAAIPMAAPSSHGNSSKTQLNLAAGDEAGASSVGAASPVPPCGGPWDSRPKLTGDWLGLREELRDRGITFDISSAIYYQGVARGGTEDTFGFGGRNDYRLEVDGHKAGLWEGFTINLHGQTVYGESVNDFTGALIPVNIGRLYPIQDGNVTALTGVKVTQALSSNLAVFAGKLSLIDDITQPFMPGHGMDVGFMNYSFSTNPIVSRTMPSSTLGAGAVFLGGGQPVLTVAVFDTNSSGTTSGFDSFFDNGAVFLAKGVLPTNFFGLPGHQMIQGVYSSGRYFTGEPDPNTNIALILQGIPPSNPVQGSWYLVYMVDQALWTDPADPKRSWGVFGNVGISDGDPNPIQWSAVVGIGGTNPMPSRKRDTFGIAYYYLGFSNSFKDAAPTILPLRNERGVELFYEVGVTPWCHVTMDLQAITPAMANVESSLVLAVRAKIDF